MMETNPMFTDDDSSRFPDFGACLAAIRRPELYRNFIIHLFFDVDCIFSFRI